MDIRKSLEFKLRNDTDVFNDEVETFSNEIIYSTSKHFIITIITGVFRPRKVDVKVLKNCSEVCF